MDISTSMFVISVCLSHCRIVCLSVRAHGSQFKSNLHQTLRTGKHRPHEELIKLWKSSASGSGSRTFLTDFSALRDKAFLNTFAYISVETDWIFMKINYVASDMDVFNRFRNSTWSGLQIKTPDPDRLWARIKTFVRLF